MRLPPVLDTTLAIEALADSSVAADHAALVAAGSWLLLQRIEGPADGAGAASGPEPSGWSFGRDGYPVVADTARVLLALSRVELPGLTGRPAIRNAIRWLTGVQSRDGSWSGSAVVTAHVVRALATHGAPDARVLRRGVVWLLRQQLPDGSWLGADGLGPGAGGMAPAWRPSTTTTVLPALLVAGVLPGKPPIRAAVDWLLSQQNLDAGWAQTAGRRCVRSGGDRARGHRAAGGGRGGDGRQHRPCRRLAGPRAAGRRRLARRAWSRSPERPCCRARQHRSWQRERSAGGAQLAASPRSAGARSAAAARRAGPVCRGRPG